MDTLNVVLLQSDPGTAQSLVACLSTSFHSVRCVGSLEELRLAIAKHRADAVILDVEKISFREIQQLSREFPGVCIVCTHRLADEEMWTSALNAGAADICASNDTRAVLAAALRNVAMSRSAAA